MESIRELYRVGHGPSSSHTMGPRNAAKRFLSETIDKASYYETDLFGSLAATGKGHLTDFAIREVINKENKEVEIYWYPNQVKPFHPNALTFRAFDKNKNLIKTETYYSVGGGRIVLEGEKEKPLQDCKYPEELRTMNSIMQYCNKNGLQYWEYVMEFEGNDIIDFAKEIYTVMDKSIKRGLENEGVLKGGLGLARKASSFFQRAQELTGPMGNPSRLISYALAVSEENASGNVIVTAPTCGSCGILPATLHYLKNQYKIPLIRIYRAILTAGLVGNIAKTNASISGAEVGCQGEVGVACAMASAAAAQLLGGSIYQIEYAAEMGLEHHLGLTCDPLLGLVQIPCIERNAMGALRSVDSAAYALLGDGTHKVSYDDCVETMMETGCALPSLYRETSLGGLAKVVKFK